ncbi:hypothetical protein [Streptomyces cucumeris]|uniref:hypothetical protein n=1 Tax=Streptomyces cucumeris TaxID=2962890 RepID=UPI0020C8599B|nr:hypothetical protein [Streptomyces sp. NEAU-Y11]MCP9209627.1 hypothetical protein [Streptomyces sp. NEAU-Y11]
MTMCTWACDCSVDRPARKTVPADPDDIPIEITNLTYTAPGPVMSQNQVAEVLAHYWPAIERCIRQRIAEEGQ